MVDREHKLPIKRQVSEQDLLLMQTMRELHLNHRFAGSRMMRDLLRQQGVEAGRPHVGTLMKKMGIEAIYRKRNTPKPAFTTRSTRQEPPWQATSSSTTRPDPTPACAGEPPIRSTSTACQKPWQPDQDSTSTEESPKSVQTIRTGIHMLLNRDTSASANSGHKPG